MAARSHHGHPCHVRDLAGAVARIRARQAGPPGEDRPAVLRHRVVDEQPLHPHLVADANVPDASGHGRVGRDEVVIGDLLEIEGWGESPGPAEGAGEFSAHVLHLPIRPVGDRLPPDDADVLDVAGIGLVADVDQRVAPVLRDDQPRNIVDGPGRERVGIAFDDRGEHGPIARRLDGLARLVPSGCSSARRLADRHTSTAGTPWRARAGELSRGSIIMLRAWKGRLLCTRFVPVPEMRRALWRGGGVLAMAIGLMALAHSRSHAQGILDFVSFDGIDYLRWAEEPGRPLEWGDLGVEFATVGCSIGEDRRGCPFGVDAAAAFMPAGTRMYAVRGHATEFRLAAVWRDRIFLYQAWRNPRAKVGGKL